MSICQMEREFNLRMWELDIGPGYPDRIVEQDLYEDCTNEAEEVFYASLFNRQDMEEKYETLYINLEKESYFINNKCNINEFDDLPF